MEEDWKDCQDEAERVRLQVRHECDLHQVVTSFFEICEDGWFWEQVSLRFSCDFVYDNGRVVVRRGNCMNGSNTRIPDDELGARPRKGSKMWQYKL